MRFIAVILVALGLFLASEYSGTKEKPVHARKLTIAEMCRGPKRPDWCREYYADLAHGREVREKLEEESRQVGVHRMKEEMKPLHTEGLK